VHLSKDIHCPLAGTQREREAGGVIQSIQIQELIMKTSQDGSERQNEKAKSLEDAAREAVALQAGKQLTDEQWRRARARVVEFASILRSWQRLDNAMQSPADRVAMRQSRPNREREWKKAA
jgi:hypothetical protein